MAQFSPYDTQPTYVSIINPQFCFPKPIDLSIQKNLMTITAGNFDVHDMDGNLVFRVKGLVFPGRRILFDDGGNPLVTLQRVLLSTIFLS